MKRRAALADEEGYAPRKKQRTLALTPRQQLAVTREVKKQISFKAEKKVTDNNMVPTSISYAGSTTSLLANLVRGDESMNDFDGGQVNPLSVELRYRLTSAAGAYLWNSVRVIVGQSRLLSTPTAVNILQSTGSSFATVSPRLWERMKNYKIFYDKVHVLNYESNQSEAGKVYINKGLIPVEYTSTGVLSITKGDIFVLVISDDAVAPQPSIEWYSRVKFTD